MKYIILGDCPSKKNNRMLVPRGKQIVSLPNIKYRVWHQQAMWQLKGKQPITDYPCTLTIILYPSTKRKFDIDNRATSVLDVLQDAGLLVDDNWEHVQTLVIQYGEYDKANPRTEIFVD